MKISGNFEVSLQALESQLKGEDGVIFGRMSIAKQFLGELDASSKGEMFSARTKVPGSAGYVAIEQVSGTLSGKKGSFVLQHFGMMNAGKSNLILEVVPDSGAGELIGLSGKMTIIIENGQHQYEFDYAIE